MPDFFEVQLGILAAFCGLALLFERFILKRDENGEGGLGLGKTKDAVDDATSSTGGLSKAGDRLGLSYLGVYAVVMAADWLQGPYVYSLYHEQYEFAERTVAMLFVTGFISAGLSGPLVGVWADQYGRKRLCRAFCLTYAGSCLLIQQPILPVLFAGRILGGLSTAILFSVFESWLVASFHALPSSVALSGNSQSVKAAVSRALSLTMGRAALVNGIVAAGAGVVANWVVGQTGGFRSPFILSGILLIIAWFVIGGVWEENYGAQQSSSSSGGGEFTKIAQGIGMVRREPAFLVLGLTQTCFEGSMYLFVFLWVPSLQEAGGPSLPLGYIFSAFMISMMLGSIIYTTISSTAAAITQSSLPTNGRTNGSLTGRAATSDSTLVLHAKLASLICACAALSLAYSASFQPGSTGGGIVSTKFWAFCIFEACVGAYYPVMGMLRGALVPNEVRATLSSLFRVPLNIFVTGALVTGVSSARHLVFAGSTLLLAIASIACALVLIPRAESNGSENGSSGERPH